MNDFPKLRKSRSRVAQDELTGQRECFRAIHSGWCEFGRGTHYSTQQDWLFPALRSRTIIFQMRTCSRNTPCSIVEGALNMR